MVFVTVAANNYLAKAVRLARTLRLYHPESLIVLCLIERSISTRDVTDFDEVVLGSEVGHPEFRRFAFTHSVVELATALKGRLLSSLLDRHPGEDLFIYLDPDIEVFGRFEELLSLPKGTDVVVTPHHLSDPRPADLLLASLRLGAFNLGFLAVRRSSTTIRFLGWWTDKLDRHCYIDVSAGLFVDQKWMDLAPSVDCTDPFTKSNEYFYRRTPGP